MGMTGRHRLGAEIRRRREAAGMTLKQLSQRLQDLGLDQGSSSQHLSQVERGDGWASVELVRALESALDAEQKLLPLLRAAKVPQTSSGRRLVIDLHIFFAGRIKSSQVLINRESRPYSGGTVHIFPFDVAVGHHVVTLTASSLTSVAAERRKLLRQAEELLTAALAETYPGVVLLKDAELHEDEKPYGLSCFVMRQASWSDPGVIARAVHLLAAPSVLLPYTEDEQADESRLDVSEEDHLTATDPIPDLERFDIPGSHFGAATWSAVAVYLLTSDQPIVATLIEFEVQLQALWCYSYSCQFRNDISPVYGAKFLRSALRDLSARRPLDHLSVCLLRRALVNTSDIYATVEEAVRSLDQTR